MFTYQQYQYNRITAESRIVKDALDVMEDIEDHLKKCSHAELKIKFPVEMTFSKKFQESVWLGMIEAFKLTGWELTVMPVEGQIKTRISIQPIKKPRWK